MAARRRDALNSPRRSGARPGATLILRVDPARALDVEYKARQIIERINAYFGYRAIAELRILQAPLPARRHCRLAHRRRHPAAAAAAGGLARRPAAPALWLASKPACAGATPPHLTAPVALRGHSVGIQQAFCLNATLVACYWALSMHRAGVERAKSGSIRSRPSKTLLDLFSIDRRARPRTRCGVGAMALAAATQPLLARAGDGPTEVAGRRADEAGRICRTSSIGQARCQGDDRRVCLDDLRPLRARSTPRCCRSSRRSTSTPARCASSSASSRSTTSPLAASMLARCAGGDKTFPTDRAFCSRSRTTGRSCRATRCRSCSRSPSRPASRRKASTSA